MTHAFTLQLEGFMITKEVQALINQGEQIFKNVSTATKEKPYGLEEALLHGMIPFSNLQNGEKYFGYNPSNLARFYMFWDAGGSCFFLLENKARVTAKYFDGFIPMLCEADQKKDFPLTQDEALKNYQNAAKNLVKAQEEKTKAEKNYNECLLQLGVHRGRFEKILVSKED